MQYIQLEKRGGVAQVVLNRPKVNALSSQLLGELDATFASLLQDDEVKGVLLRGEGKCLSAGLDLKEVATLSSDSLGQFMGTFDQTFSRIFRFPKPLAVAVTGHAIAGGLILALCADFVALDSGEHRHGLTELQVGVPFPPVALEIVEHASGGRGKRALVYGADTHSPQQLFEWGVGDDLSDAPIQAAQAWLEKVTSRPLATFHYVKTADRRAACRRIDNQTLRERQELVDTMLKARQALMGG